MTNHSPLRLNFTRKLLLSTAALLALAIPLVFGVLHASATKASSQSSNVNALLAFTNVSVRPNTSTEPGPTILYGHDSFSAENASLRELIRESYALQNAEIVGPDWLNSEKYDVNATVDSAALPEFRKLGKEQQSLMLQPVLADRFKLAAHRETRVLPVYSLVVTEGGPKVRASAPQNSNASKAFSPFGDFTFTGEGQAHCSQSSGLATG